MTEPSKEKETMETPTIPPEPECFRSQDEATIEGLRKKVEESQRLTRDILAALEVENLDHLLMRSDDTIVLVVAEITRLTKERIAQLASARARIAELEGDKAGE